MHAHTRTPTSRHEKRLPRFHAHHRKRSRKSIKIPPDLTTSDEIRFSSGSPSFEKLQSTGKSMNLSETENFFHPFAENATEPYLDYSPNFAPSIFRFEGSSVSMHEAAAIHAVVRFLNERRLDQPETPKSRRHFSKALFPPEIRRDWTGKHPRSIPHGLHFTIDALSTSFTTFFRTKITLHFTTFENRDGEGVSFFLDYGRDFFCSFLWSLLID